MVWLGTNRDHSVVFEISLKYCISGSVDYEGYSMSSMERLGSNRGNDRGKISVCIEV